MQKIFFFLILCTFFACSDDQECNPVADPACICPDYYDPVCGCDGKTYGNSCEANCNNIKDYTKGPCAKDDCKPQLKEDCFCYALYDPVCGCDNRTYGNDCEAGCNQVSYTKGVCVYNAGNLVGTWEFLGFVSEGAKFKSPAKTHKYDHMNLIFEGKNTGEFNLDGRSATNFFVGKFEITNLNQISLQVALSTKIGCIDEACPYEKKYMDFLNNTVTYYFVEEGYLKLVSSVYFEGEVNPKEEILIFKKK